MHFALEHNIQRNEKLSAALTFVGLKLGLKASLLPCKYTLNVNKCTKFNAVTERQYI